MADARPFGQWERTLAVRYLRAKRKEGGVTLVSWISFVGILLAVATLIIVMSVMNGFRTELIGRMIGFNGDAYVNGPVINGANRDPLLQRLRALPNVRQAIPVVEAPALAVGPDQTLGVYVRALTPKDLGDTRIISTNIKDGTLRGFGDGEDGGDIVAVGSRLAETLGVHVGDSLTLLAPNGPATVFGSTPQRKSYTVGAVFTVGMYEYDSSFIYMPLSQAQLFFGRDRSVDLIQVDLDNPDHIDQARPQIARAAGPAGIVSDWRDRNHSFFNALQVERSVMRLILMLIVGIAVLNIISGLVMLVKNKGRDIAILRTMGASQGSVLRVFFMCGAMIGASATLAGLLIGSLFCIFIDPIQSLVEAITHTTVFSPETYFLSRIPARIEWSEVAIVVLWSLLMSFVATLPPAWRASRLDPVEALRYE
ncbi:MAG: lipoprotein-releasing ABC transporter permease subunit [Caulobacteraceae bacterium]